MAGSDQAFADDVRRQISVRLIPLLIVIYIMAHLDRVNVSFAALTMNQDLNFSDAVYGLGAGLFFFGYFLFEVPANLLLERIGARRLISGIMLIWGTVSALMACVATPTQFYVMRFVLGVAEAGLYPGIILYLTYWFRANDRATAIGQFALALAVAGLLGSPFRAPSWMAWRACSDWRVGNGCSLSRASRRYCSHLSCSWCCRTARRRRAG